MLFVDVAVGDVAVDVFDDVVVVGVAVFTLQQTVVSTQRRQAQGPCWFFLETYQV